MNLIILVGIILINFLVLTYNLYKLKEIRKISYNFKIKKPLA